MAVDLLAERPARPARAAARHRPAAREPRAALRSTCPVSPSSPPAARPRVGPRAGELAGLDEPRDRRLARRRRVPAGRVRRLGAALAGADAADAAVPQPRVLGGERRIPADVLRDVRLDLPAQPVPAERAGLLAARGGRAHAAVDGDADDRRPDRGRLTDRIGGKPLLVLGLALQAIALGWMAFVISPTVPYTEMVVAVRARRASAWGSSSRRSRPSS